MHTDTVAVRGANDIGSAVAHRLFQAGFKVVLHDDPAPAHLRRGMAFTDAFFAGSTELDGVSACLAVSVDDLTGVASGPFVTALPFPEVLDALRPGVVVDARMRKRAVPEDQRAFAALSIGLGPGFEAGRNCSVAIETAWGESLGQIVRSGPTRGNRTFRAKSGAFPESRYWQGLSVDSRDRRQTLRDLAVT